MTTSTEVTFASATHVPYNYGSDSISADLVVPIDQPIVRFEMVNNASTVEYTPTRVYEVFLANY